MMYLTNLFKHWTYRVFAPGMLLREKYEAFRELLEHDKRSHELIAELEQIYYDQLKVDFAGVEHRCNELSYCVERVVQSLTKLCPTCYADLVDYFKKIHFYIKLALAPQIYDFSPPFVFSFDEIGSDGPALVGGKAFNLIMARKRLNLPVPNGFTITATAFNYFVEANNLRGKIDEKLATMDIGSASSLERTSRELMEFVLTAQVPDDIEAEIEGAFREIRGEKQNSLRVSVRSSGVGEDGQASFAGQYRTVLNVDGDSIIDAYKEVIASKYSPRALYYRVNYGLSDRETPMAVLVLEMIDARASGVIYSRDPAQASADTLIIHTIWGLGEMLVNGRVTPSVITVSRERPHQIEQREDTIQAVKAVSAAAGGIQTVAGDDDQTSSLALTETTTRLLAEWAMKLEAFHGNAQDIEWCMDQLGELYILQSRPLQLDQTDRQVVDCADIEVDNPVLLSGGVKACGGIGAGVVHRVAVGADLESLPEGAVLVASTPSPDYVKVMGKLNAVVTDGGSAAGHFASVAREFGVPTLVNTGSATKSLSQGREVTVNTHGRIVYEGRVQQLLESACAARSLLAGSPFMERMTKILDHVSPLNLVDPTAVNFAPGGCKTLHDILRFCHEKSVHEMFSLGDRGGRRAKGAKKLVSDIPITVHLLDLDGGLRPEARLKKEVDIDDIASGPFRAVWKGLSNPGIYWDPTLKHFDWQEFDRISAGIVNIDKLGSYAIISKDYLNVNIHFGYHFVVLDTLCGDQLDNNYIMLRFTGGGADFASRMLRIEFLGEVLCHYGFEVEKKGDLIDAQLSREAGKTLEKKLEAIGILLGCTRLLDMALKDGSDVDRLVKKYMSGEYDLSPISRK